MNTRPDLVANSVRISRAQILGGLVLTALTGAVAPAAAEESTIPRNASLNTLLGAKRWLNGVPTSAVLSGKVVLVDVFTFDCFNCQNITPNLRTLSRTQRDGLTIVGIHSPETSVERNYDQVVSHLRTLGVTWPVAIDNDFALWKAYHVEYWPTQMIFDRHGKLRNVIIGDSQDATVNAAVSALLREPA